ncbi:Xanthine phosphoribosyltransferase 1 [Hanseniaspora vineae]
MTSDDKMYISYNNIHKLCKTTASKILSTGPVDVIIAISGGGLIPSRIIRSFLKVNGKNIPIQAIGLSLYENMGSEEYEEKMGKEVVRTQWLDLATLEKKIDSILGKRILIVDEVDDTRTTLHYALSELEKEIEKQQEKTGRTNEKTEFSIFVLHNKTKPKKADLPADMFAEGRYYAAEEVPDKWLCYPWDAQDIDEHTKFATEQGNI